MKRKILWMMVSFLLVAALVLASCAKEVPGEQEEEEEEEEEEEPAVGVPQYGGTLTWFAAQASPWTPLSWDNADLFWMTPLYTGPYLETLLEGDILKYGPRGTNEFPFDTGFVPEQYLKGNLAESWEVTAEKITFKIRPGVMWAECKVMESRELTAADVAHSLNRMVDSFRIRRPAEIAFVDSVIAQDKYTVVITTNRYDAGWAPTLAYGIYNHIQPPELVEAGAADWRNHVGVGTGAFLLTTYDEGASATYVKNPNWWNKKQIINGKEYDTPFVDELVYPFTKDVSTFVAVLRSGKIDFMQDLFLRYEETLKQTTELSITRTARANLLTAVLRCDQPPFDDVNVRRAMMIGLDLQAVCDGVYMSGVVHGWPFGPGVGDALYTPIDELPASTRELFEYDTDKARQMLADADYPDDFELDLIFRAGFVVSEDAVALVAAMWDEIGVKTNLVGLDEAAYTASVFYPGPYKHAAVGGAIQNIKPALSLVTLGGEGNHSHWEDEYFRAQLELALSEPDLVKQSALMKDLAVYGVDNVTRIPLGVAHTILCVWPWVKNYHGEGWTGDANYNWIPIQSTLWIDQDLKAELGY